MHRFQILPALTAFALVSACADEAETPEVDESANVGGEVLDASVSDAMLPIDEVRSRAPQAAIVPQSDGAAGAGGTDGPAAGAGAEPANSVATPVADEAQPAAEPAAQQPPVLDLPPEPAAPAGSDE